MNTPLLICLSLISSLSWSWYSLANFSARLKISARLALRATLDLTASLVDTTDAHDKGELGVSGNIVISLLSSLTPQPDLIPLLVLVLLGELLGTLEDIGTLG